MRGRQGIPSRQQAAMTSKDFGVLHDREGEWASLRSFLLEGVRIPHFFAANPASLNEYIVNFQTRADDVFVVSYPKSGMKKYYSIKRCGELLLNTPTECSQILALLLFCTKISARYLVLDTWPSTVRGWKT